MRKIFCLAVLAFSLNAEEIFNLSIKDALESEAAKKYILPNVKVEFASGYDGEKSSSELRLAGNKKEI